MILLHRNWEKFEWTSTSIIHSISFRTEPTFSHQKTSFPQYIDSQVYVDGLTWSLLFPSCTTQDQRFCEVLSDIGSLAIRNLLILALTTPPRKPSLPSTSAKWRYTHLPKKQTYKRITFLRSNPVSPFKSKGIQTPKTLNNQRKFELETFSQSQPVSPAPSL